MGIKCPKCSTDNPDTQKFCGECATPLPASKEIPVTKTLETPKEELTTGSLFAGRYQIIEVLGKGGMGKVYRVLDIELKEEVALKLIKPEIASDKKTIERFRNELNTARKIGHRNVCRMYDLNKEKDNYYITMEYVSGGDLKKLIRRTKRLDIGTAISIAKQICEGLEEAHNLGIVHRDLKPNNIMIDDNGNARIMDFGIARTIKEKGITGSGIMIGTPEYMSPEQVEAKEVDQRSDIYSLGVILYEMLTGKVPFEGDAPLSIAIKHKSEIPKSPKDLNPHIPADLNALILKCMEKVREDRYQSVDEIMTVLNDIEKGIPTTQQDVVKKKSLTSKEITVTFSTKRILIPAFIIITIAIIGLFLWKPWLKKESIPVISDRPILAILYFENNTGDKRLDHWREAMSTYLTTDLSQSKYLEVLSDDEVFNVLRKLNLDNAKKYSSGDLFKVASQAKINHIVTGDYITAGNRIFFNVTLHKLGKKKETRSFREECESQEKIPDLVDVVSKRLKTELDLSSAQISADIDKEVGGITTNSSEALNFYMEGRRFHAMGNMHKAIEMFEDAIALDTDFAMAYWALAGSHMNIGNGSLAGELLQKALEMSDRMPDRLRLRIQASQYRNKRQYDELKEVSQELVSLYPEDYIGWNLLGLAYANLNEPERALQAWNVPIQKNIDYSQVYINQAMALSGLGRYDESEKVLVSYIDNFPDNLNAHRHLAQIYAVRKKFDLALEEIEKSFVLSPRYFYNREIRGKIYAFIGDFGKAEKEFMEILNDEDDSNDYRGYSLLSSLYLLRGQISVVIDIIRKRLDLAIKQGEKRIESNYRNILLNTYLKLGDGQNALKEYERRYTSDGNLLQKTWIYIDLNLLEDAQKTVEEARIKIEEGQNKKNIRYYYRLKGRIEAKKGNFPKAIELIKKAISFVPFESPFGGNLSASFVNSLADTYFQSKQISLAKEEYEKITSMTYARWEWGITYAKAFYMLGLINEDQGNRPEAIEYFEKFLDLWKDADPGLPELEDAKKRLAGLKSQ